MDPRYTRASSPPRHYTRNPNRNSTSVLDLHPQYDQYGNPKGRDPIPGPRPPTERIAPRQPVPPRIYRDAIPIRSNRIDDYDIPPRRHEPVRRPVSVTPGSSAQPYRPSVPEKPPPSYVKPWPREDESYYIQPASTARRDPHNRHISMDQNKKPDPYLVPARSDRDRPERGGYRSSGIGGSRQQYQEVPQIRPPRDKDDKDYGYEYTDFKEQAYRDINNAPRARPRRTSDLGGRERPHSITGIEDTYRPPRPPREGYGREAGPPVSTRGFSKIDRNGSVRHEYRYPREPESARSGDESDATSRRKTNKPAVSLHQEGSNGYSSNIEERGPKEHRHRHRADSIDRSNRPRGDSIDRAARPRGESNDRTTRRRGEDFDRGYEDKNRYPNENDDLRRKDHREKRQENVRTESEERRPRHHHSHRQYREGSQDLYKPEPSRRGDEPEKDYKEHKQRDRGDESEREHRHRDRADDYDKRRDEGKKDKQDSHYGTGAALGAAGAAAAGLLGAKHHFSKEKERAGSDASSEQVPREGKPSRVPEPSEASSRNEEHSDEERRERRRKRREEKDARARQETLAASGGDRLAPPPAASTRAASRDRGGQYPPPSLGEHSDEERKNRRHRRRQSERRHSSTDSASDEPQRPRQVRVVSPGRQPEVKPKGILRRPREKFPEDPAPVREGVAPLKDAGKKGIPPNARWTKIDRRLVNPEALNMGNERFEERLDYVIVLRVLSKEEIEQYAQKTVELRGKIYRAVCFEVWGISNRLY